MPSTAMANPATVDDLVARGYTPPDPDGPVVAQTRLDEVWRALRAELRTAGVSIETLLASGAATPEDLRDVVANATLRVLDNPEGIAEESEQLDDWSRRVKLANPTADIYFTRAELHRLLPAWATTGATAGSLRYTR